MMRPIVAVTVLLLSVAPAWAQAGPDVRGSIEEIRDSELLVRTADGRLHVVDTAAMPSTELATLTPGDTVVITTRGGGVRGPIGHFLGQRTPASPTR
jgi:hypothetical protein